MSLQIKAQESPRLMLETGSGYFANINLLNFDSGEANNSRMEGIHSGTAIFMGISYKINSNYWIGVKYTKANLKLPYNDSKKLFWENDYIFVYDIASLSIKRSFKKGKHYFDFSGGPLIRNVNGSKFDYLDYTHIDDKYSNLIVFSDPELYIQKQVAVGLFLAIDYKYNIFRQFNLGIKIDGYSLLFLGKEGLIISPTFEVRL